jgi:hypothetical protein
LATDGLGLPYPVAGSGQAISNPVGTGLAVMCRVFVRMRNGAPLIKPPLDMS